MSKTIEEAANEYAANWEAKHNIHNPELYGLIVDAYKASAERMMSLPLASRLTDEEKERVRKIYYDAERGEVNGHYDVYPDPCEVMRVIFGSDFFKEGE